MARGQRLDVVTSELGYLAKIFPESSDDDRTQVGEFLQTLEDHDDVHRVWAAVIVFNSNAFGGGAFTQDFIQPAGVIGGACDD